MEGVARTVRCGRLKGVAEFLMEKQGYRIPLSLSQGLNPLPFALKQETL